MSDTVTKSSSEPAAGCACADSAPPTTPACSPICRRTRSQVAKRNATQQQSPSSSIEICNDRNVIGSPPNPMDTALDSESGLEHKKDEVNPLFDHISGIRHASSITELDIAPNMGHHNHSPASLVSASSPNDSMPNFSIGDCPIIVSDSLVIYLMVNEITDIICNDLLAEVSEDCASRGSHHNIQTTITHVEAPFAPSALNARQIISSDENSRPHLSIENFASHIVEDVLSHVFQENFCLNCNSKSTLNEIVFTTENYVNANVPIIENIENCLSENVYPNEINAPADLSVLSVIESSYIGLNEGVQIPEPDDIGSITDDSDNLENQTSQSFVIVIESDSDVDECTPADCLSNPCESSYPNFSLGVVIPGTPVKSDTPIQMTSPTTDDHDFPQTDEIELFQIITENRSTITFETLLPQKRPCLPTFDLPALFTCEYCERKFQNETDAQAHIFDLHLNPSIPSYQEDQAITLLRNYPDPGCTSCKIGFLTLNTLNQHCMKTHNSKSDKFSCSYCYSDFPALTQFFTHRCCEDKDLLPRKPFHCHKCDEYFESLWQRESHICSGDFDDISDGDLSESEPFSSHPILFPIMTNSCPQRSFLYDNPECEGSLPDDALMIPFKASSSSSACGTTFASSSSLLAHPCNHGVLPQSLPCNIIPLQPDAGPAPILNDTSINFIVRSSTPANNAPLQVGSQISGTAKRSAHAYNNPDTVVTARIENQDVSSQTNPPSSHNLSIQTPAHDSSSSQPKNKIWACSFPGCSVVKASKKALSVHRYREHKIQIPKRCTKKSKSQSQPQNVDHPSQGTSHNDNLNSSQGHTAVLVDPVSPTPCPTHTSRSADTANFLFPLFDPTPCTEDGCVFQSRGVTWNSIKCSMLRHLRTSHHLTTLISVHWCATCTEVIGRPKKHRCLTHGCKIELNIDTPFACPECGENYPNELALRNHVTAHKQVTAQANTVQRVIPRMGTRKWKRKTKTGAIASSEPPDESITDPTCILAPPAPPTQSTTGQPTSEEDDQPPGPLAIYIEHLQDFLNQDPTEEFFQMFSETMDMAVSDIQNISFQPSSPSTEQSTDDSSAGIPPTANSAPKRKNERKEKKEININDPQSCQILFSRNRKRCVREICEGPPTRCSIPVETIEDFFRSAWDSVPPPISDLPSSAEERTPLLENAISNSEVAKKLSRAENSAPGPDMLTYHHWRSIPQCHKFLATAFNVCLHFQRIPTSRKKTITVLIPKTTSELDNPANWRPIALSNTLYKIFTKVLAGRLQDWSSKYSVLSHCQKGFTPFDGVLEHNFTLQTRLEFAREHKQDLCVAWLDITNAFGALPHQLIYKALHAAGTGDQFINVIKDIYTDCSTSILSNDSTTSPIPIKSGVQQGCPISGLLFNVSIDHILKHIQGNATRHRILAFADDLCLLGDTKEELQDMLDVVFDEMSKIGLLLNPKKSFSLHLSASTPVDVPDTSFHLGPDLIHPILEYETTKFLGKPLSPWQKLDALKSFIYPAMQFSMRTGQFKKEDWTLLDDDIRHTIKELLFLPERAANEYLYGHTKSGCVGVPIAAEESDLKRVDSAFKLLTSHDEIVAALALQNLRNSVANRVRIPNPSDDDLSDFMTGSMDIDEDDKPHSNPYSNIWTTARVASRRQKIQWLFTDGFPQLKFQDLVLKSSSRRKIFFTIRNRLRQDRSLILQNKPDQGKAMECVAQSPISSHFIANGMFTRFSEYRFIHRAKLNLLPLNGLPWKDGPNKRCRSCTKANLETLPHVINHCEVHSRAWV
ncbi:Retrovirus-related Pol polyprotein from type-1 retrotransposable element R2 [Araneus ventricosus]|uniref:Retrovirus-related Pol polyprotein from type-1 retrotransposable element R2 n=1 Tax=Araneus ventricosus TaxID=182803 RepID=A0A4Y2WI15_ARAVE|nr:Retrovirus-related Pol polyprotein from type-1 retrotransposable element R2 [Araneus ventricosus]